MHHGFSITDTTTEISQDTATVTDQLAEGDETSPHTPHVRVVPAIHDAIDTKENRKDAHTGETKDTTRPNSNTQKQEHVASAQRVWRPPPGVIVFETQEQKQLRREQKRKHMRGYLRQTFIASFCALMFVLVLEFLFLYFSAQVTSVAPYSVVHEGADVLLRAYTELEEELRRTPQNASEVDMARARVSEQAKIFVAVLADVVEKGHRVFVYDITFSIVVLVQLLVAAAVAYFYRSHKVVRSRGKIYPALFFTSTIALTINAVFMAYSALYQGGQFTADHNFEDPTVLHASLVASSRIQFTSFSICLFLFCIYFSTIIARQRLLIDAMRPVYAHANEASHYKFPALLALMAFSISEPMFVLWYVRDLFHPRGTWQAMIGPLLAGSVYMPVTTYYYYKARKAPARFNDYYSNLRVRIVNSVTFLAVLAFTMAQPHHIFAEAGWTSFGRVCASMHVIDQVCTQALQAKWEAKHALALSHKGTSLLLTEERNALRVHEQPDDAAA